VTEQEWLTIYRDTVPALYGHIARRAGGNRPLCEDIVQETYLRALESWGRKTAPDSPLAWLKRVAQNILIDHVRHSKWTAREEMPPEGGAADVRPDDPIESLEFFSAISRLRRKQAEILQAFYYDGMTVREIAADTHISERAVEGQLRRARRSLKILLPDPQFNGGNHV
jgi:RNA polymerase sigma-70 factor (ECF subfamily)